MDRLKSSASRKIWPKEGWHRNIAGIEASHTYYPMSWVIRAADTGPNTIRRVREAVRALDPAQPFSAFATMDEIKADATSNQAFQMTLLATFASRACAAFFTHRNGLLRIVSEPNEQVGSASR